MAKKAEVKSLFYITHIENVRSILDHGILSHARIEADKVPTTPIYDAGIVSNRKEKATPDNKGLWQYANVYFQPRNPMMYRVIHEKDKRDLAVIGVNPSVMTSHGAFITDGNAASSPTQFYEPSQGEKIISQQWKVIQSEWWNDLNGSKRKIMAECLVPDHISPSQIHTVFVSGHESKKRLEGMVGASKTPIVPEPKMFFQPSFAARIGENISLIEGDMFFSTMQTLTVSVNLQGIMGKGLASRAKYQFPDVYVYYQDACRSRKLKADKPCIYKRESSLDDELADLTTPLSTPNAVKWFMLFATKRKWREDSRVEDIEGGLEWFCRNHKKEGVQSVALPALGCGLGGLQWRDIGPLMCRYLHGIGIDVAIYLPREKSIDQTFLSESHLLRDVS